MESNEETLRSYKALVQKNKATLASLHKFVSTQKQLFPLSLSQGFQQMKQQYELALASSKASIDRNAQLQAELQINQERLKTLRERFYMHFEEMEGLEFQMKRVTGQLKRQLKNKEQSSRAMASNERLKRDLEKLQKMKKRLQEQEKELVIKQKAKRQNITNILQQIQESQKRVQQEERLQAQKIKRLQQQIQRQELIILQMKRVNKSITPQKRNKLFQLEDLLTKIRSQKKTLQD